MQSQKIKTFPNTRFPFTPYPDGLFAVAFSNELKAGQVSAITFMGEKVVLFRGESGTLGAVESFCPHLGANLADGLVKKDTLQCPFHGLLFNTQGDCISLRHSGDDYRLRQWHVCEKYGVIFLMHNPLQKEMDINLPDWDTTHWGRSYQHRVTIKSHPQEILENSVDRLHFFKVHHYQNVKIASEFQSHGSEFSIKYVIERPKGLFPNFGWQKQKIKFDLYIHAYGLGFSKSEISIPQYGLEIKQIVMPTPVDKEHVCVRTITSAKLPERILCLSNRYLPKFIKKIAANTLGHLSFRAFLADFQPDITIWENKTYIHKLKLLPADGEFIGYRNWASQFYR